MSKIVEIDKNFVVETEIQKDDIVFYNVLNAPFKIYGVFMEDGRFRRMPRAVAKTVSPGVEALHTCTSGGRVRFVTDSPYIAIKVKVSNIDRNDHFTLTGSAGFDLYFDQGEGIKYHKTFRPPYDMVDGYESVHDFKDSKTREITINMPLYTDVEEMYIGLSKNAEVSESRPYKVEKPVVFYGSSVTQGGCASRPGNSYQAMLSREFDFNFVNLGFSGSGRAEDEIIDYIKGLDMSVFVSDYDYNSPTVEHYRATHEKLFSAVRSTHPDIPIIIMTCPNYNEDETEELVQRIAIARRTYENALAAGDKNVYFVTGRQLMAYAGDDGTVDDCHPTDLGFKSMAKALEGFFREFIDKI